MFCFVLRILDWVRGGGACSNVGGADLLEVGREAVHVLVVGQHGVSLSVEEVDVPDAKQSQQDRSILVQRSCAEVVVLEGRETCSFRHIHVSCVCCLVFLTVRTIQWAPERSFSKLSKPDDEREKSGEGKKKKMNSWNSWKNCKNMYIIQCGYQCAGQWTFQLQTTRRNDHQPTGEKTEKKSLKNAEMFACFSLKEIFNLL